MYNIGQKIKELRKKNDLTQEALAERLGITYKSVSKWESGMSIPDLEKIVNELESGELDLDKSIEKYTEAMKLIQTCEKKLNSATKTVNKLVEANGNIIDFEVEE